MTKKNVLPNDANEKTKLLLLLLLLLTMNNVRRNNLKCLDERALMTSPCPHVVLLL